MRLFYRSKKGFTLVEMMIVVAIIALLAAIAVPSLLRARHNANESASIGAMRTLYTALESFRAAGLNAFGTGMSRTGPTYPANLAVLSRVQPPYAPTSLTGATGIATARQGYFYTYGFRGANQFTLQSSPSVAGPRAGATGSRFFYIDEGGVLRHELQRAAGPTSAEVQ